jgi:hypothetical protein
LDAQLGPCDLPTSQLLRNRQFLRSAQLFDISLILVHDSTLIPAPRVVLFLRRVQTISSRKIGGSDAEPFHCVEPKTDRDSAAVFCAPFPLHSPSASSSGLTDPRYQDFLSRAASAETLGVQCRVAALPDLFQGKPWAASDAERRPIKRGKDELDLMRIADTYPEHLPLLPAALRARLA